MFSGDRSLRSPLSTLDNATRLALSRQLNKMALFLSTCTGCSLIAALEALAYKPDPARRKVIILISDDSDGRRSWQAPDLLPLLRSELVTVNTVTLGHKASPYLQQLAAGTGGRAFVTELHPLGSTGESSSKIIRVLSDAVAHEGKSDSFTITKDSAAISGSRPPGADEGILQQGHAADRNVVDAGRLQQKTYSCLGQLEVVASAQSPVSTFTGVQIAGLVRKAPCIIVGASVKATVKQPGTGTKVDVQLYDNGVGGDQSANDGVYSVTFSKLVGMGQYDVTVIASNTDKSVFYIRSTELKQVAADPVELQAEEASPAVLLPANGADGSGARRRLAAWNEQNFGNDLTGVFVRNHSITFTVTVDLTEDKVRFSSYAESYELRMSTDRGNFQQSFNSGVLVKSPQDVISGSLTPQAPYTEQEVVVAVPPGLSGGKAVGSAHLVHIAIVVVNKQGLRSKVSNPASVYITVPAPTSATTPAPATSSMGGWWGILIYVLIGLVVLHVVFAVLYVFFKREKSPQG
ncbi:calcium-activated chloride channel regulator 2-like [Amblyomma americanum]